jgi:tetratricopeptide (TPR) repeat protein/SAM-dependent methyltransferase
MIDIENELSRARAAQRAGDLVEAGSGFGRVLAAAPDHGEALFDLGVLHLMQGEWDQALARFDALAAAPSPAPQVLGNRGFALWQLGRLSESLASYDRALALDPAFADALYSRAVVLLELRRTADAIAGFEAVLARTPDHPGALANRGQALLDSGRTAEALASLDAAHRLDPDNATLALQRAVALGRLGRRDEAMAALDRILAPWPEEAGIRNELGNALRGRQEPGMAARIYRQALALAPGFAAAFGNLGYALLDSDRPGPALSAVRRALTIDDAIELKALFIKCLGMAVPLTADLRGDILRGLRETWGRPSGFGTAGLALLRADAVIGPGIGRAISAAPGMGSIAELLGGRRLADLSEDRLLIALLEAFPLFDPGLERLLTCLRRAALDEAGGLDARDLPFLCALARQAFVNEYVYGREQAEDARVAALRAHLASALEGGVPIDATSVALAAAYAPLADLPFAERLLAREWPHVLDALLTQQIREPAAERLCAEALPRLTPIADDVSTRVRAQYEQNPFPRWVRTAAGIRPTTLGAYLRASFPLSALADAALGPDLDVLIAGCGTGQHSTETALQFVHREMLAIDLSRTSLGYGERKRRELGLGTLRYAQGDIMELGTLDRRFGLIEASGVLHHLADPFAGWRVLLGRLASGGVMHLGFYSALARGWIVEARGLIAGRGYGNGADEIRRFRTDMLAADDALAAQIRSVSDFYAISTCRDLLFHSQEHRLTLPEIAAFLGENGLNLLGFDLPPEIVRRYRARFPGDRAMTDLASWDAFEIENPDAFLGMYQFWVQKA